MIIRTNDDIPNYVIDKDTTLTVETRFGLYPINNLLVNVAVKRILGNQESNNNDTI